MTDHTVKKNPVSVPYTVWHVDDIRRGEREAADTLGLTLYELMLRTGGVTFQVRRSVYPDARHWLMLCGHGNNGGDDYTVARLAMMAGIEVTLLAQKNNKSLPEEAALAHGAQLNVGGEIHASNVVWSEPVDLIVGTLLGTDLQQAPRESTSQLADHTNSHPAPIVTVDIPSGPLAEIGATPGTAISTDRTVTLIALKPGLLTGKARDVTGQLYFDSLRLDNWLAGQETKIRRFSAEQLSHWLKPCRPASYKSDHEWLVIIGGGRDMAGVIHVTGEATLHAGAGLVRVLTRSEDIASLLTAQPESMMHELTMDSLIKSLERADMAVAGPGLGQQEWGGKAPQEVENFRKPMLWDADALSPLAISPDKRHNRVIMSRPGEAARLLGCSVTEIGGDRLHYAKRLVQHYGGIAVLRGTGTVVVAHPDVSGIIDAGNAGMASGSMGDVLSDAIGALFGQKLSPYDAVCTGCVTHGVAADVLAARFGTREMLAIDLFSMLQHIVNPEVADRNHDESSSFAP